VINLHQKWRWITSLPHFVENLRAVIKELSGRRKEIEINNTNSIPYWNMSDLIRRSKNVPRRTS
jgi:hypothetical protein